ncbi:dimethylaniline monooxygenase, partial [Metarhizium majus ARSEF 297]
MKVAVIGGGPSGLVTLKYLAQAHEFLGCEAVEARLFEYQPRVGGTFSARVYEDAELVSSKQLTTFSDFRRPDGPDFLSATDYVDYLEGYCTHFDLWPRIHLDTRVLAVKRRCKGHTVVYETKSGHCLEWDCDAIAVCSGLHVEPNVPDIKGLRNVPRVIHSSEFKARKQFSSSRTVMVVGSGETGADIAYLAVTTPSVERVILCHRDGFHFAPKRNPGPVILPCLRTPNPNEPGIPIDISRANMFDTTYVHKMLRRNDTLLWEYYHIYIRTLLFISSGTTLGMDQWIGGVGRERDHPSRIFFNKSMKVCPYISEPYRPKVPGPTLWLYSLRSFFVQTPIPDTHGRCVDLAPFPLRFDSNGTVEFTNNGRPEYDRMRGQRIRPDMVVMCTGYKQSFPFLNKSNNANDIPYPTPDCADVRQVWKRDDPTVGFIGFVRPSLGAIPPLAEMQTQLWVTNLLSPRCIPRTLLPEDEHHYKLRSLPGARIKYGVDHESYAYQLALDLDSAPGILDIIRLFSWRRAMSWWKLLIIWILGAHLNTKFRLKGPWKWHGAFELLTSDEFWQTITRRPIIFGTFRICFS